MTTSPIRAQSHRSLTVPTSAVALRKPLESGVAHQPVGDRVEGRRGQITAETSRPRYRAPSTRSVLVRTASAPTIEARIAIAAHDQRVKRHLAGEVAGEREHAEQHHRDRGHRVGLEEVGRHAGAVADVVADVVGDHGRVARVVLGDPGLDLADEVGADVGGLGEDAAAESGEDGDQRTTEPEADQRVDRLLVRVVGEHEDPEVAGDAEQGEADDQQAGDRAALEGDVERRRNAAAGGLRDAGVGADREVHADEAGGAGQRAADHEPDRGRRRPG